ncbi:hypothetical protein FACS1894169_01010 [Bacteroidia bacterium]|nr:hypothetical protein FACS1894169_01010 [Bacteroidia bacterium]
MRTKIFAIILAVLFNTVFGGAIAFAADIPSTVGILGMNIIGLGLSFAPMPSGVRAGIYVEVWTGQIVERFTHAHNGTFLDGVPDFSQYVNNSVIHLVEAGLSPTVLIDNTTYPLSIENLPDGDVAITLHKFETLPTRVTDDELYAISYDKIGLKKDQHGDALAESHLDKAIHAFAPVSNTAKTPVLYTTGTAVDGRKTLLRGDVVRLKRLLDKLKIPKKGRRLVLCSDHINDLLDQDQKFKDQYHNYETGVITKMYGFEIYEATNCPLFDQSGNKLSFGAVATTGQFEASVFFYVSRMFKAKGDTTMYYSEAKTDPVNKQNLISFTNRFVALPQVRDASCGAIASKAA